jgi:hypothetical protein
VSVADIYGRNSTRWIDFEERSARFDGVLYALQNVWKDSEFCNSTEAYGDHVISPLR